MNDRQWQEVRNRKKGRVFTSLRMGNQVGSQFKGSKVSHLNGIFITLFVSNFPTHFSTRELWNVCSKFDTVIDVFIAKKKNKVGRMFAFVRYRKDVDVHVVINKLCNTWIGKLRLIANVARYDRNGKSLDEGLKGRDSVKVNPTTVGNKIGGSYANIVKGITKVPSFEVRDDSVAIILDIDEMVENKFLLALVGCVAEFNILPNVHNLCKSEGFLNVKIKYIGGLWVLLDFHNSDTRDKFLVHTGVKSWFQVLEKWSINLKVEDRLAWLDVEGLPLKAWHSKSFSKIASKWGNIVFSDDSDGNNLYSTRLCIQTSWTSLIYESLKVIVNGCVYHVRVKEICGWCPEFTVEDSDAEEEEVIGKRKVGDDGSEFEVEIPDSFSKDGILSGDHNVDGGILDNASVDLGDESDDPFNLNKLLVEDTNIPKVQSNVDEKMAFTPLFPSGFTPMEGGVSLDEDVRQSGGFVADQEACCVIKDAVSVVTSPAFFASAPAGSDEVNRGLGDLPDREKDKLTSVSHSCHLSGGSFIPLKSLREGFSMLEELSATIGLGRALGFSMLGCENDLKNIISDAGDNKVFK